MLLRGNEPGTNGGHDPHIRAVGFSPGIHVGVPFAIHQFHRAQQPDGARSENDCAKATRIILEVARQPLHQDARLLPGLLCHRKRFQQDGHLAQLLRYLDDVPLFIDDELGHISVRLLDAPLDEIASDAEVLATFTARATAVVRAGAAHRQHRQVAGRQAGHPAPDVNDFAKCFVPNDQVWRVNRRRSVLERGDLAVGPADPGLEYAQLDFGRPRDHRLGLVDESDLTT